ncbi:ATP-binding cassette domain-containing protein, partial [Pantoea septica]|uniref:ATP-binding cassette domain-containing protein n=1 Tax=Pantoea septica TaxID=472695 RepID=UPI00289C6B79
EMSRAYGQRQIAWLGQNPQLPAGTLQENIVMGNGRDDVDLDALLADCGVSEFLPRLSAGVLTPIGDDGAGLSVGQAQRIALARALYKPARLLLLDEPAASLDSRSEQHVMRALDKASRRQTTLMITHQLDALQQWDAVWVMQEGQLTQQGQWRDLIAEPGPFRQMASHRQKEIC